MHYTNSKPSAIKKKYKQKKNQTTKQAFSIKL